MYFAINFYIITVNIGIILRKNNENIPFFLRTALSRHLLVPVHKQSVFHVFELESSNSGRVKNLKRSPEVAFVRFFKQKAQSG
jgi:hypothetical protein